MSHGPQVCVGFVLHLYMFVALVRGDTGCGSLLQLIASSSFRGIMENISHNTLLLRVYYAPSKGAVALKIQPGTKLWIALNSRLRYKHFILQLTLVMKWSSIGKMIYEFEQSRE